MPRFVPVTLIVGLLGGGAVSVVAAQDLPPVPQLNVGRLGDGDGPVIDGRVEESSWASVEPFATLRSTGAERR